MTQVFFPDDPYLENDTIGAVKPALVRPLEQHDGAERRARRAFLRASASACGPG